MCVGMWIARAPRPYDPMTYQRESESPHWRNEAHGRHSDIKNMSATLAAMDCSKTVQSVMNGDAET